jgi:hypothetical protein
VRVVVMVWLLGVGDWSASGTGRFLEKWGTNRPGSGRFLEKLPW